MNRLADFKFHHGVTILSAVAVAFFPALAWPAAAVVVASFGLLIAQKFVPEKEDATLAKLKDLEQKIAEQQTEISKLNVMLGVGMSSKNRENLIRGLTGSPVG